MNRFVLFGDVIISPLNLFVAKKNNSNDTQLTTKAAESQRQESSKEETGVSFLQREEGKISVDDTAEQKEDIQKVETEEESPIIPVEVETMTILSSMISCEDFETGISNPSEKYFEDLLKKDRLSALNGISSLFLNNYTPQTTKARILVGLLHIVSHFDYESVYPAGQMMALCALSHVNREVAEYGIKCYENWGNRDGIEKLQAVCFSTPWLKEYADEVIEQLNEGD